jgi:hypothetical protein
VNHLKAMDSRLEFIDFFASPSLSDGVLQSDLVKDSRYDKINHILD